MPNVAGLVAQFTVCHISTMDISADTVDVNKEELQAPFSIVTAREVKPSILITSPVNSTRHRRHRQSNISKKKKKKNRRPKLAQRPVLRPAGSQVPRAPENSTQFIMDNHENSNLFYNFDSNKETSKEEEETKTPTTSNKFAVNDFEKAYRSAHEESLMNTNVDALKSSIVNLESRCANAQHAIASRPSVLLDSLQSLLIELQEENRHLRQENHQLLSPSQRRDHNSSSSSSSSSSSYSDSDSSSDTDCSQPDCEQCTQQVVPQNLKLDDTVSSEK